MGLFRRKKAEPAPAPEPEEPKQLPEPPEVDEHGLRDVEDQREWILSMLEELPPFGMQLMDALGLGLCEDIRSDIDLPGFDNSAMDGFAVRSQDLVSASATDPIVLPVLGEIAAGDPADLTLTEGHAIRIMTGAPVPDGADAVIPFEQTDRGYDEVCCFAAVPEGRNIRTRGADIREGDLLLTEGTRIDERTIGLLAGIGIDKVMVRPRPRVVVVSTGSELIEPGTELESSHQIYDSNSWMLSAAAKAAGAQVFHVGLVPDDPEVVQQTISDQLVRADLLITSGGVSEGDHDIIKQVLPEMGLVDFARIAMQPGKPQGFGLVGEDEIPVFMLPGNPVSSFVSFETFVRPAIRKLMGVQPYVRQPVRAIASTVLRSKPGRAQFHRGHLKVDMSGRRTVEQIGGSGSYLLGALQRANCLILMEKDVEMIAAGQTVMVWPLDEE